MGIPFGGVGINPTNRGQPSKIINLQAGAVALVPPGTWMVRKALYTIIQEYDPRTGIWRAIGDPGAGTNFIASDGVNIRLANQTGCVVGALVKTAGSGYSATTPPTWTLSGTSNAILVSVIGGALSTTVTVTNGGSNYKYPPQVLIGEPNYPGVQATAYAVMSGTFPNLSVSSITVVDQGGGYLAPPPITLVNDPRDTTGYNATAVGVLTGAGTLTAVVVTDHGNPVTAVPTPTISSGSGAIDLIMCWTITAYTVTSAGSGYVGAVEITGVGGFPSDASILLNPTIQSNLVRTRKASILAALTATTITATGQVVYDGGIYTGTPTPIINGLAYGTGVAVGNVGFTMGGVDDVTILEAI